MRPALLGLAGLVGLAHVASSGCAPGTEIPYMRGDRYCCNCDCVERLADGSTIPLRAGFPPDMPAAIGCDTGCGPQECDATQSGILPIASCEAACLDAVRRSDRVECAVAPSNRCDGGCMPATVHHPSDRLYEVDTDPSNAQLCLGDSCADLDVVGTLSTFGGNCSGCEFAVSSMGLTLQGFTISNDFGSVAVTEPTAFIAGSVLTTVASGGRFVLPENGTTIWARFLAGTTVGSQSIPFPGGFSGVTDDGTGRLVMDGVFRVSDYVITLHLVARPRNLPPDAVATADALVECSETGGAVVRLDGTATSDPDGPTDIAAVYWVENFYDEDAEHPSALLATGTTASVFLPVGEHEISLWVMDETGAEDIDTFRVSVVDTTAPEVTIEATPGCLWPPDHRLVRLRLGSELTATVTDACDPAPVVELVDVVSSEPDNGLGDGDTASDVRIGFGGVCVRRERDGRGSGRTYTIGYRASDASGNTESASLAVVVPHDSRGGTRCPDAAHDAVVDGDPRCDPAELALPAVLLPTSVDAPARPAIPRPTTCAAARDRTSLGGGAVGVVLVILGTALRRRRHGGAR